MTTPDGELAEFAASADLGSLPPAAIEAGRRLLLDAIASAFAGRQTQERPSVEDLARRQLGEGAATVIGGGTLSPAGAVLLNGFQVTAATICDVHRPTLTHVSPEVVPAALAAAEATGASGAELLAALVVGAELTVRVAEALDVPAYRERAWHNPGVVGPIGAAAAVARVHRLDERGMRSAMGHAASQAAGTFAALGTPGVKLHQARGALSGLLAGELAAAGLDAAPDALTASRGGLLAAYADGGAPERLTAGLGTEFRLTSISMRRWPAASSLQGVIAATLRALEALHQAPGTREPGSATVASARVELPPRGYLLNGTSGWQDQLSAMQSARWVVAVIIHDGELWIEQTLPDRLEDAAVGRFAGERVTVASDEQLPASGARVTLVDIDGREHVAQLTVSPGDPEAVLGDAEIVAKLRRAASGIGLGERADEIASALASLPMASSVHHLLDLVRAPLGDRVARHRSTEET